MTTDDGIPRAVVLTGVDWVKIGRHGAAAIRRPIHPGVLLGEWLHECRLEQGEFGARIGLRRSVICEIVNGKRTVGPSTAIRLEQGTGVDAEVWLQLQAAHTIDRLRSEQAGQ